MSSALSYYFREDREKCLELADEVGLPVAEITKTVVNNIRQECTEEVERHITCAVGVFFVGVCVWGGGFFSLLHRLLSLVGVCHGIRTSVGSLLVFAHY